MKPFSAISTLIILILNGFFSQIHSQQLYVAKTTTNCSDNANSALGYTCNGLNKSCQAYLIFRSKPPYNTVSSISALLSSDPSQVSEINSVSETASFETNKLVIVPINCSCSGNFYQHNASYTVQGSDSPFLIANDTYQGLSTCQALQDQNKRQTVDIFPGQKINVPLRCACPTKNQTDSGIRYLLSYLVTWGDTISGASVQFGVDTGETLKANPPLSETNTNIYPFTTLLIPLQNPPSSNQTIAPPPPPFSPPPPPLPPSGSPSPGNTSDKTWIYVLVGVLGGIVLTLVIGSIIFFVLKSNKSKTMKNFDPVVASESFEAHEKPVNKKFNEEESIDFLDSISSMAQSVKVYKFKELEAATDNFSPSCLIEGSVYRGLINGDYAAIKKVNGDVPKEIELLNKINHFNLIRLSGVCFNDGNWYLVYEYAENGPLSDWIHDNDGGKFLNWTKRVQIALDVATGLNYLHSFTSPPHVHKDIRSSTVLLDGEFRGKIANFAMARPTEGKEGEFVLTRHIIGTKGYMAPEYLENGLVSTKLDVYAFGILMLEMISGKEVSALYTEENMNLSQLLSDKNGQDNLGQFIDPSLQEKYPFELSVLILRLIDSCLSKNPSDRPSMDEITQSLSRIMNTSFNWESSTTSGYKHSRAY